MKIPFFNYQKLYVKNKEAIEEAFFSVMERGAFILQSDLEDFESALAKYTGAQYAFGVANGTDALWLSMLAAGLKPGDEVLMPSHTYIATPGAARFIGLKPVLVECGADHLMDPNDLQKQITNRTKAIIPVQLNGRTCNMADIINYSDENDLLIIEDAAQGIGSKFNNQMAGTFGIAGTYSFYPAKTLGCYGDGGAVGTNDTKIADAIYELRDHGRAKNGNYNRWGINSRLDNIQAAILLSKLKTLDDEISRRREIANRYINGLGDIADLTLPPGPNDNKNYFDTFQNFEIESGERDKLKKYLSNQGIGTIVQWGGKAVHQIKCLGFDIHLPFTDKVFQRCLLLPMNTTLSDDEINYVIENIRSFYKFN